MVALFRRRVFRIQVYGRRLRIVISRFQALSMLLVITLVYSGSLIEASNYNSECTVAARGEFRMPPQTPPFSAVAVIVGLLLLFPCLVLVRKRNWRVLLAGTSTLLVIISALFFKAAFDPMECFNSGGMTDGYDAPGICEILVYALVLVADYLILLLYAMNRATVIVRHKYRTPPNSGGNFRQPDVTAADRSNPPGKRFTGRGGVLDGLGTTIDMGDAALGDQRFRFHPRCQ